jgi:hypothetical protein
METSIGRKEDIYLYVDFEIEGGIQQEFISE